MGKCVKQLADEFGVSKTAIRKRFTAEFKAQYVETNPDGSLQVNDEGCKLIEESLQKPLQTAQTKVSETSENQGLQETVAAQKETVAILKGQLDIKDEQIKAMSDQMAALQAELERERQHSRDLSDRLVVLTDQAQQLHAGTIKERLTVQEQDEQAVISQTAEQGSNNEKVVPASEDEVVAEQTEKKKSWREKLGDWIAGRK